MARDVLGVAVAKNTILQGFQPNIRCRQVMDTVGEVQKGNYTVGWAVPTNES